MISYLLQVYPGPHNAVACGLLLHESSRAYARRLVPALLISSRLHSAACQSPDCETTLTMVMEDALELCRYRFQE